jgi:hypothetical protein
VRSGTLNVLALDPGGSTGWALYSTYVIVTGPTSYEVGKVNITQGQLGPADHHLALWNLLGMHHASNYRIVCESFEFRGEDRTNIRLISNEYIGVVKLFCQERNDTLPSSARVQLTMQTASSGKGFWYPKVKGKAASWDGSKLKAVGLYHPTTDGRHINDATAHLLQYLTFGPMAQKHWLQPLKDL